MLKKVYRLRKAVYVGPKKEWRGQTFLVTRYIDKETGAKSLVYQADSFIHPMSHGWHNLPRHHVRVKTELLSREWFTPSQYVNAGIQVFDEAPMPLHQKTTTGRVQCKSPNMQSIPYTSRKRTLEDLPKK